MKLVEILARELEEWPSVDGVECGFIVQELDGELYTTHDKAPMRTGGNSWWRQEDDDCECGYLDPTVHMELAEDWTTAIITREMWEAERSRIKGEKAMPKANKDGWIRHRGGKCPVDGGAIIDVRLANGDIHKGDKAGDWGWNHEDCMREFRLMAWRPHKPVEQRIIEAEQSALAAKANAEAESPAAKYFEGPIQWRDRIREIDAASKEEEARHCDAMAAYDAERTSLVDKLKAEGFVLIQGDEPNSAAESDQQDMSDPANWRKGDLVKSVNDEADDILIGGVYVLYEDPDVNQGDLYLVDSAGDKRNRCIEDYAFHSRPTN